MTIPNHYDTLGVRPNASIDEIELAYKGRRTQYHPDRYSASDAATLQWATEQMQQVNAAYACLKEPAARAALDLALAAQARAASVGSGRDGDHVAPRTAPPPQAMTLKAYLKEVLGGRLEFERVYVAPHIPQRKLMGAIESRGAGLKPTDVVVLVDDTMMGGAGDGVIVTEQAMVIKEMFDDPSWIPMRMLKELTTRKGKFYVDGHKVTSVVLPDATAIDLVFSHVAAYAQRYGDQQREPASASGSSQHSSETVDETDPAWLQQQLEQAFEEVRDEFGQMFALLQHRLGDDTDAVGELAMGFFKDVHREILNGSLSREELAALRDVQLLSNNLKEVLLGTGSPDPDLFQSSDDDAALVQLLKQILAFAYELPSDAPSEPQSAREYFRGRR